MGSLAKTLALTGLLGMSASCISGSYARELQNVSLLERAQSELPPSGIGLAQCLATMGAPQGVYEHEVHGLLLVYAWERQSRWTANFSVPAGDSASASFNVSNRHQNQEGVVLWLDAEWKLTEWKHGNVRALIGEAPRPATMEQLEAP